MGLIAITALSVDATHGVWGDEPSELVPAAVVHHVQRAGHRVVMLPSNVGPADVGHLDGLLALRATGGALDEQLIDEWERWGRDAGVPVVTVFLNADEGDFSPPLDVIEQAFA